MKSALAALLSSASLFFAAQASPALAQSQFPTSETGRYLVVVREVADVQACATYIDATPDVSVESVLEAIGIVVVSAPTHRYGMIAWIGCVEALEPETIWTLPTPVGF